MKCINFYQSFDSFFMKLFPTQLLDEDTDSAESVSQWVLVAMQQFNGRVPHLGQQLLHLIFIKRLQSPHKMQLNRDAFLCEQTSHRLNCTW